MSKISDQQLLAGLKQRKKPENIAAEVKETIVSQMHRDAMQLPLASIKQSPFQIRHINEQTLEEMMESIRNTGGLISPVVVRPVHDEYELIAGHTRYLAYQRLGYTDIPAVIRFMNDAEASRALAADNLSRKDLVDYEIYKTIQSLLNAGHVKSNSEASRLLGRSRQDIIRYLSFAQFPPSIIELLEKYPALIGASAAKSLLEFLPQYQDIVLAACQKLADNHLKTQTALIAWIRQQIRHKPIQQEQIIFDQQGNHIGKMILADNGLRLMGKFENIEIIEAVIRQSLRDQGYKL